METLKEKSYAFQKLRDYKVDDNKYILVHIDGRSFSKMVKNKFNKPFDKDFITMMNETAKYLCSKVQGTHLAFVQSDEITLVIKKQTEKSDIFFSGRLCKMQSIIASLATSKFNQLMTIYDLKKNSYANLLEDCEDTLYSIKDAISFIEDSPLYQFDCKVWDVDTSNDVMAWLLFRNIDCVKNSKQQAAQAWIPHKYLLNRNTDEQIAYLKEITSLDWHTHFTEGEKYGRYIYKDEYEKIVTIKRKDGSTEEETCMRTKWEALDGMDLTDKDNREKLINIFPILK
jgi:tRNA(His) 5'-end guanylyltransferase